MAFKLIGSMTSNLYILKGQGEVMLNRGAEGVFILSYLTLMKFCNIVNTIPFHSQSEESKSLHLSYHCMPINMSNTNSLMNLL